MPDPCTGCCNSGTTPASFPATCGAFALPGGGSFSALTLAPPINGSDPCYFTDTQVDTTGGWRIACTMTCESGKWKFTWVLYQLQGGAFVQIGSITLWGPQGPIDCAHMAPVSWPNWCPVQNVNLNLNVQGPSYGAD